MGNETIAAIVGVVIGFALTELKDYFNRNKKHSAYWAALNAEIEFAKSRAKMFIDDRVQAPLYRLPTTCYENCYPELLTDGKLSEVDSVTIMSFFTEVYTFNRGLDLATAAKEDSERLSEYQRNRIKAKRLIGNSPAYLAVTAVVNSHLNKSS